MNFIDIKLIKIIINDEIYFKKIDNIDYNYKDEFGDFNVEIVTLDAPSGRCPSLVLVEEHTSFCYDDNYSDSYFIYREIKYSPLTGNKVCYKIESTIDLSDKYNELSKSLDYLSHKRCNKQEKVLYKQVKDGFYHLMNNILSLKLYDSDKNYYYD